MPLVALQRACKRDVAASLEGSGIGARLDFDRDKGGLRLGVTVSRADLALAREWQAGYGRSYGAIRIFLEAEAEK